MEYGFRIDNKLSLGHEKETITDRYDKRIVVVLSLIVFSMSILSFNTPVVLALIFTIIYILGKFGIDRAIASYIFVSIWARFTTLPVFSGVAIIALILGMYILLDIIKSKRTIKLIDFIFLIIVVLEGILSLFATNKFEGLMLIPDVLIACYASSVCKRTDEERLKFWNRILYYMYISTLVSIGWGFINFLGGNYATLYFYGAHIPRFKATIGTDRSCLIYCASLVYCLFFQKKRVVKIATIIILVFSLLSSFSITAVLCLFVVSGTYLLYSYKHNKSKTKIVIFILGCIIFMYILYVYNYGSHVSVIDTIVQRFKLIISRIDAGDTARATSGRTDIWQVYIQGFQNQSLFNQLFGSGYTSLLSLINSSAYSHNTYLDMLFYFGYIPFAIIIYRVIKNLFDYRHKPEFINILMMKEAYIITVLSVSMFTNEYFWLMFII